MKEPGIANEWIFDYNSILKSPRKVTGKFHTPKIDKDNEYIEGTAIRNAVPDFMHLPILHDFHKERTVGIVTRVVELSDGSFDFEGLIKATDDCNDIWELIKSGNYDRVSLYGKRTCGSQSCSVKPERRVEPCITTGVRFDSISVCDDNARNDGTSLFAKGKVVFNVTEDIIKAETTNSSLMHTVTDKPRSDGLPRAKKKCTANCPQYERPDVQKGEDMDNEVDKGTVKENRAGRGELRGTKVFQHQGKTHFSSGHGQEGYSRNESIAQRNDRMGPTEQKGVDMDEGVENIDTDGGSSVGQKLDQLIEMATQLVQKDEEVDKGDSFDENYKDKTKLDSAEYDVDQGEEHDVRDQDTPLGGESMKTAEEKALTSDDELNHLAAKYHLEKQLKLEGQKRAFTESSTPMGRPDSSSVDAKAATGIEGTTPRDPHRPPGFEGGAGDEASFLEAPQRVFSEPPSKKKTSMSNKVEHRPGGNPDFKTDPAAEKESQKNVAGVAKPTGEGPKPTLTAGFPRAKFGGEHPEGVHKPNEVPSGNESQKFSEKRMSPEQKKNAQYNSTQRHGPPIPKNKEPYQGERTSEPVRTKPTTDADRKRADKNTQKPEIYANADEGTYGGVREEKADGGDIESKLDTLISVFSKLLQTDAQVHSQMGASPVEEKAISKGTEIMDDEEVNTLVKAKVDAQVTEITKAFSVQIDELKKANDDLKTRIEKMEGEVIEKSGVAVILREGDEELGTVFQSNASAISKMGKPQKAA